ncbi:MAG: hypothetical protein KME19_09280 [Microcoleus vaginatus WJT46-NPBG5]|nr:hypothetical protein [Microcoleus vaginatus WJT46-NPBG5]
MTFEAGAAGEEVGLQHVPWVGTFDGALGMGQGCANLKIWGERYCVYYRPRF